ncbi:hypothetical protein ACQVRV_00055 (plasmid) [Ralstonia pseudosolanacearum]
MTVDEAHTLTTLLAASPVALTGQETMIPLSDVLPPVQKALTPSDRLRREKEARNNQRRLWDLLRKPLRFESADGAVYSLTFVTTWKLVDGSSFLRYCLNPDLLKLLEQIKQRHKLDALV